jgi:gamma-glutamylcyclotransferase (GGCT)/AIG2-like uncharacterized protein YtfP
MTTLFAYGTLLFPEVLTAVTGRALAAEPAALDGYVRRCVIGEIFPAIVEADRGDRVAGLLYLGVDDRTWNRLDRFEGDLYERRRVKIATRDAFTYVLGSAWRHRLGAEPWDPAAFARDHLDAFLARLAGSGDPRAHE